jgi:hypothetical protein
MGWPLLFAMYLFGGCMLGPETFRGGYCMCHLDYENDSDVDLRDWAEFQNDAGNWPQ